MYPRSCVVAVAQFSHSVAFRGASALSQQDGEGQVGAGVSHTGVFLKLSDITSS
jgi:hypothetical protein